FKQFATNSLQHYHAWAHASNLAEIRVGDQPKALISEISESLLQSYSQTPLLSKYDIYQIRMDYWGDTMQDDVYVLVQD
ncbi:type I restriction endonuclease subunit M, partial [Escherichia coli]|nr:type I restriction endonuclease subunit M [Escherichia coli]